MGHFYCKEVTINSSIVQQGPGQVHHWFKTHLQAISPVEGKC